MALYSTFKVIYTKVHDFEIPNKENVMQRFSNELKALHWLHILSKEINAILIFDTT